MDYLCSGSKNNSMIKCANPKDQYLSYKEEIDTAIHKVLDSGWYVLGNEVREFEKEFSQFIGISNTIGVGSGTEALHIALRAVGVGIDDEVILPSHTAVATASAIISCGAKPVFVDIDPNYFTINTKLLENLITQKTKAIIPVHIYGQSCDMGKIIEIAKKYKLFIIEDCAQAHGAKYKDKCVGSIGDVGCFSFYPTKNLGAIGDGGAVVTNNSKLANKVRLLREYGWEQRYISNYEGWNSRLDELQAAILRIKLKYLNLANTRRIKIAENYFKHLSALPLDLPFTQENNSHVYHLFVIKLQERDRLKLFLENKKIISTIQYPVPIHKQKFYSNFLNEAPLSVTDDISDKILSLPIYPELDYNDQKIVINNIKSFFS